MFASENIHSVPLLIQSDPGAGDEMFYLLRAPRALTIVAAYAVCEVTMTSGTAIKLQVENWGTAGTAVEGTVVPYIGGTAAPMTARMPVAGTVNADQDHIDKGEWLNVRFGEDGGGWQSGGRIHLQVDYVFGLGA